MKVSGVSGVVRMAKSVGVRYAAKPTHQPRETSIEHLVQIETAVSRDSPPP